MEPVSFFHYSCLLAKATCKIENAPRVYKSIPSQSVTIVSIVINNRLKIISKRFGWQFSLSSNHISPYPISGGFINVNKTLSSFTHKKEDMQSLSKNS
jgi:hypothetical protein